MNIKLNIKRGLRRIVLSIIGFAVICAFFCYVCDGCIWDTDRFLENTKVFKPNTPENHLSLQNFANVYLIDYNSSKYYNSYDFKCHPYKQYCEFEGEKYNNGNIYKFTIRNLSKYSTESLLKAKKDGQLVQAEIKITMPSRFKYFLWQLFDLLLIFIISGLIYGIYLIFELIFCWIIKGFKND